MTIRQISAALVSFSWLASAGLAMAQDNPVAAFALKFYDQDSFGLSAVGDFDRDGYGDIVIDARGPAGENVGLLRVYYGDGRGGFHRQRDIALPVTWLVTQLTLADMTGDGVLDIVVLYSAGAERLDILPGDGFGGTTASVIVPLQARVLAFALGDLNRDGLPDVAARSDAGISVLLNEAGGMRPPVLIADSPTTSFNRKRLILGDVTGDSLLDLVTVSDARTVLVHPGDGRGGFHAVVDVTAGTSIGPVYALDVGDMNEDERLDIVAMESGWRPAVLLNGADGAFTILRHESPGPVNTSRQNPLQMYLADYNGDGRLDVAFSAGSPMNDGSVHVFPGTPSGRLTSRGDLMLEEVSAIAAGDLNKDGIADLVATLPGFKICDFSDCRVDNARFNVYFGARTASVLSERVSTLEAQLAYYQAGGPLSVEIADLLQTAVSLRSMIADRDATIAEQNSVIAQRNAEIAGLRVDIVTQIDANSSLRNANTQLQSNLASANRTIDSLVRLAFGLAPDVYAATAAGDKARAAIDRAAIRLGHTSRVIAAADSDYTQGVVALESGAHSTAMTWFESAYTRVFRY